MDDGASASAPRSTRGPTFVGYFARVTPESHVSHGALCVPVFAARSAA
jgi:hypothetical protein